MEINDKYQQVKLIEGFEQFNYIDEVFEISDIKEKVVMLKNYNTGVGCGIGKDELLNYFQPYQSEIEREANDGNIKLIFNGSVTIAILPSGIKGISKCLEEDEYIKDKGIKIAIIKAKIKELNKELKILSK